MRNICYQQKRIHGKQSKEIANILMHDIAPNYTNRLGGYTRMIKLNNRKNDNAPISLIEFIDIAPSSVDEELIDQNKKNENGDPQT